MSIFNSHRWVMPLLCILPAVATAQRVSESTVSLPDPDVAGFWFVGDHLALAIEWAGGGKDARINAYNVANPAALWRHEVRVRESDKSPGRRVINIPPGQNRLYLGNGPLTVLNLESGQTLWSLDCKTVGSFDYARASFLADSSMLVLGSDGCGEQNNLRLLRVEVAGGAVRWQMPAEAHTYKAGNVEHWDFSLDSWSATPGSAVPTHIMVAGKRLFVIDYATGRQVWALKDEPGRNLPMPLGDLSLWIKDDKLFAYRTRDGGVQWQFDLKAPWADGYLIDPAHRATSDLLLFTYHGAFRLDRASGQARWSMRRDGDSWGQSYRPPLVIMADDSHVWHALDPVTGQERWRVKIEDNHSRRVNEALSASATGVILFAAYDREDIGPYTLIGVEAASGKTLWKVDRVNDDKIILYTVLDSTRIVVFTEDGVGEVDPRTGAVTATTPQRDSTTSTTSTTSSPSVGLTYSKKKKTLTYRAADGHVVWTRSGEESENANTGILASGVVVWPTQNGKVELIALATGASLQTVTGNSKPVIGVDNVGGHVLVPQGKTLHIITVTP